ncbi:MAG TPA: OmpA family protein [Thermoanaerobaculia bacterium]|nr:OmpA family protein [Thermoanaerobaculia bacterium]
MKLTPFAKFFLTVVILGFLVYVGYNYRDKLIPGRGTTASVIPKNVDLPSGPDNPASANVSYKTPGSSPGCTDQAEVRMNVWAWNAQMGLMAATGGKQATDGSLMCGERVNLKLVREDDSNKMQENLTAFATSLRNGNDNPKDGVHFVAIMGDGAAQFLKGLNDVLRTKLGPEYQAKIIGSCGYSRGEDKFMGPAEWKSNPSSSKGGVCAGVLRDGDWNIAQKWLGDNGLRNNPDEHTWDPDALNWVAADTYVDAAKKYVEGYAEERPVVRNGKPTGERKRIMVNSVVTWTPGDVTVAEKRGGIISIVSTREYSAQMPNVIIGIDKWMKANRSTVEHMLTATLKGGDAVKGSRQALEHAAKVSAEVYNEETADYWLRYFQPVTQRDKQGIEVSLGGSYVNNLADNLLLFGLVPGSSDLLSATYTKFGDIDVQQYPKLIPNYPKMEDARDASYLNALIGSSPRMAAAVEAEKPKYDAAAASSPKASVVGRRSWAIEFDTGKATFTPQAEATLNDLSRDLLVASGTLIQVHGHTDSQGSADANQRLSEDRAFAVKQWLMNKSSLNFPSERISVHAHGATNPIAPNSSTEGRSKNRRVEIVLVSG